MPWPDLGGTPNDPLGWYARPDLGGLVTLPEPRFANVVGSEMGGFPTVYAGQTPGIFGNQPPVDGPTWTSAAALPSASPNVMAYGNGVACTCIGAVANTVMLRSADFGRTWTSITLPTSAEWKSIATDGKGTWVAIAGNNSVSAVAVVSKDNGRTWISTTMPASRFWYACEWGNGQFVALGFNGNAGARSSDGYNWTAITLPSIANWRGAAWGNGTWVIMPDAGTPGVSVDGITWSNGGSGPTSANPIRFGGGIFFVVNGSTFWSSRDGKAWVSTTLPISGFQADYSEGLWVVAQSTSAATVAVSSHAEDAGVAAWAVAKNSMPSAVFWVIRAGPPRTFIAAQSGAAVGAVGLF